MTVIGTAALNAPIYVRYQPDIEDELTRLSIAIGQTPLLQRYHPAGWRYNCSKVTVAC